MRSINIAIASVCAALLTGCATTEVAKSVQVASPAPAQSVAQGPRVAVAIGKFDNRSNHMRGVFSDGQDRLGEQARSVLTAHLQQSNRFSVLDRDNLENSQREAAFKSESQKIRGADFLVTGAISEFGRKEVGDHQLFGVLGRGKSQIAYAKVTLNVVNSLTSEVVASAQGAGEYELSNREVLGFGSTASYDATLNGKVLDLAIREAVTNLTNTLNNGRWNKN